MTHRVETCTPQCETCDGKGVDDYDSTCPSCGGEGASVTHLVHAYAGWPAKTVCGADGVTTIKNYGVTCEFCLSAGKEVRRA